MALLTCPRCGGTKKDPTTDSPCEFCGGAGKVEVNDKELEVKHEERRNGDEDVL